MTPLFRAVARLLRPRARLPRVGGYAIEELNDWLRAHRPGREYPDPARTPHLVALEFRAASRVGVSRGVGRLRDRWFLDGRPPAGLPADGE